MKLTTRVHEWLADHISWVQYPQVRAVSAGARVGPQWRVPMPWPYRVVLLVCGLALVGFSLVALGAVGVLFWALITG